MLFPTRDAPSEALMSIPAVRAPNCTPSGGNIVTWLSATTASVIGQSGNWLNTPMPMASGSGHWEWITLWAMTYEAIFTARMASGRGVVGEDTGPVVMTFPSTRARPPIRRRLIAGSVTFLILFPVIGPLLCPAIHPR